MDLSSTSFFHDHRMLCLTGPITSVVHSVQRNHQTLLFFSIPGIALVLYFILVRLVLDKYLERCDLPPSVPGLSVLSIGPFFRRRFEFLNWGFRITGQSAFRFRLLNVCTLMCGHITKETDVSVGDCDRSLWRVGQESIFDHTLL